MKTKEMSFKQRRRRLINTVARLLKPRSFLVRIWDDMGVALEFAWKSWHDMSLEKSELWNFGINKRRTIYPEELREILEQIEGEIVDVCDRCDCLANDQGLDKMEVWDDILYEAKKRN